MMTYPLAIGGVSIITSIIGTFFVRLGKSQSIMGALFFFFQAEDGIRVIGVTGVQTCALPILMLAVLTVWAISVLSFMIIHLPPGDYVTSYIASMSSSGSAVSEGEAQALREQLGLDKPITVQYAKWMGLILQGNFGMAMEWGRPVSDVIGD